MKASGFAPPASSAWRRLGAPALGVALVATLAFWLADAEPLAGARAAARRDAVPATTFASKKVRNGLFRAGRLFLQPPADLLAQRPLGRDGRCPELEIGAQALGPEQLPSTVLVPAEARARRDSPLVSLYLEPCRLRRLVDNPEGFGPEWEEPGWVSYFEGGELRFASPVAVRLQGGFSRKRPGYKSFRLIFRDRAGATGWPGRSLAPGVGDQPIEQVILHNDLRHDQRGIPWQLSNSLSYDIARHLGALAPETLPIRLLVNGEPRPPYVLTERIDKDWLRRRFGHDKFDVLRAKGAREPEEQALWDEAARWAATAPAPLLASEVEKYFDLDNLTRWYLTVLVCSTGDVFQAVMTRDRRGEVSDGRWFFVAWDMDMSFRRPKQARTEGWKRDQFRFVMGRPPGDKMPPRILLHRLLNEDPEYRSEFLRLFVEVVNHRVDERYLRERLDHYAHLARTLPVADLRYQGELEKFFQLRFDEMFRQLSLHFQVGPPQPVTVHGPAGALRVDGYEVPAEYHGRYPSGLMVAVAVAEPWRSRLAAWRVDGELVAPSDRLELTVTGPLVIEAVMTP
ncbi:MAG: CotH kinase family protein [Thermoanaerobaculia bacterium]|nr:CotH kinase family protein [Thermoanaerobaculia bacterium]